MRAGMIRAVWRLHQSCCLRIVSAITFRDMVALMLLDTGLAPSRTSDIRSREVEKMACPPPQLGLIATVTSTKQTRYVSASCARSRFGRRFVPMDPQRKSRVGFSGLDDVRECWVWRRRGKMCCPLWFYSDCRTEGMGRVRRLIKRLAYNPTNCENNDSGRRPSVLSTTAIRDA